MNLRLGRLLVILVLSVLVCATNGWSSARRSSKGTAKKTTVSKKKVPARHGKRRAKSTRRHRYYGQTWSTSPYADSTEGDDPAGDDPLVRDAAIRALGPLNGSIVVVEPHSGRILSMVNETVALGRGYTPCSTIKVPVALAALQEGVLSGPDDPVRLGRRWKVTLTEALAHSNNNFFERVGSEIGFEKISKYERDFGFGELAGYNIPGEVLGSYPEEAPSAKEGGVGRMCSFGTPISVTPLQLAAFVSAVANGGTLYYLQHPRTPEAVANFHPIVKRELSIKTHIPAVREGMMAAVLRGTARRLDNPYDQVAGKTGTCSDGGTRLGWFASFESPENPKLVVVVLLRGGRYTVGPRAAEVAGRVYRFLHEANYYALRDDQRATPQRPATLAPATVLFNPGK